MPGGNIQGRITIAGGPQAQRQLRGVRDESSGLDQATKKLGGGVGGLLALGTGAGAAAAAVNVLKASLDLAVQAARAAAVAIYELAQRAGDVAPVAAAFERISSPDMLRRLQLATQGLVSNQRIMQEFSQAARAGVLSQAEIADAFSLVTQAAQEMGRSVDDSIRALGTALSTGELGSLAELGVNVGQVRTEVTAAGISAESAAGRTRMLQLAMGQLRADMPDLGTGLDNTGDGLTRISVAAGNARDAMARSFGTNQELAQQLTQLGATLEILTPAFVRLGDVLARSVLLGLQYILPVIREIESALGDTTHTLSRLFSTALDQGEDLARRRGEQQRAAAAFASETAGLGPRGFSTIGGAAYPEQPGAPRRPTRRSGGGGRGGSYEGPADMAMGGMLEELAAAAEQSRARQLAGRQKALQDEVDLEREQLEIAEALAAQREKAYTQQEEALELQRERTEAEKDAVEAAADYALEQREIAYATAEAVAGTFSTLAGIMGQVIQQQEAAGESAVVLKAIQGGFLIAYNAVMAATEVAKAIGSYPDVAGILAHSAAAAAHVSAAVMAAAQLGGGSAAGASAAAAARPAAFAQAEQPRPSGRGSDQGVTIHQQYLLSDSESGLARSLERATWQRRRQYRAARSDAVRYGA